MENLAKPEVKFGDWIGEGWRMFTSQWKQWVINTLIYLLICFTPMFIVLIGFYVSIFMQISAHPRSPQPIDPSSIFIFYGIFALVGFFTLFLSAYFMGGMHRTALKQLRGEKIELRDLFSGGSTYLPMLGSLILGAIVTSIGMMLCIIPGFLAAGCLFFSAPLIVDRKLGAIQAMQTSYELAKKNIWMFALFAFVVQLIASVGSYACYVGLLATIPMLFTISAVAYRDCFGMEGATHFSPTAIPPQNPYAQPYPPTYQQPPSATYGQSEFEPPPSPYNQPFGYPPPQATPPPPPPPVNEFTAPPMPPPIDAPRPAPPQPEASNVEPPTRPQTAETLAIESLLPPPKITCPSCQASLPATAAFCPRCGNRIAT